MSNIQVEITYPLEHEQTLLHYTVAEGTTVVELIAHAQMEEKYPELKTREYKFGIFGKLCKADAVLHDKDRVEIYRPLIADPKEARKKRAAEGKQLRKGKDAEGDAAK